MIEDVCDAHVIGADPFQIERLWRDVYGRGYSGRPDISLARRAQRHRDGVLGHRRQGRRQARLRAARRARARAPARLHVPLPRAGRRDRRLPRSRPRRRAGRRVRGTGLHGAQVRSGGALHDLRPAAAGARGARPLRALRPDGARGGRRRAATCCSAPTASSPRPARSGSRRRLEAYDPLWFEEPTPPELPEEMARVARATSIPIATGERLTTKYEFARVLETGAASILQLNLGRVGGLLEAKKIAAWPRRTTPRSRPTSTAARSSAPPTSSSAPAARTSSSSKGSSTGAASTPRS